MSWPGKRLAWLGLVNPLTREQTIEVELLSTPIPIRRSVTLPPRSRQAHELGGWGAVDAYGVEVRCGSVCASSLVIWDAGYTDPYVSVPATGCLEP